MAEKIAIYTAIFGGKDDLKEPHSSLVSDGVDLICFTDDPEIKSSAFQVRLVTPETSDARTNAKKFKILPHQYLEGYDITCWMDGSFRILRPTADYLRSVLSGSNMAFCQHWDRDCVYAEADESIRAGRLGAAGAPSMANQVHKYQKLGLPEHSGIYIGGILIRRQAAQDCKDFMEAWWKEIQETSQQDQLSLGYLHWRLKPNFKHLTREGLFQYFKFYPHCWYEPDDNRVKKTRRVPWKVLQRDG